MDSRQLSDISQQIADIQESPHLEKIRQEEKNKINKRWIWMRISIIVALAAVIVLQSFPHITKCIQNSIQLIGGFWGFCNLALNLWSKFNRINYDFKRTSTIFTSRVPTGKCLL